MPRAGWKKLSPEEQRLAQEWTEEGKEPQEIAELLKRDKSTITRLVCLEVPRLKQGRPKGLTSEEVDRLIDRLDEMVHQAKGRYHVTVKMLKRATRTKVSTRTISDELHKRKVYFRKFREKPLLTDDDVKRRMAFATKYRHKSAQWWNKVVHAFIDGKHFQVYLNAKFRRLAARHATFGAYRSPGKGLSAAYVKPKKSLKTNTGARSALVIGGIGRGRCFLWHDVPKGRWCGEAAAHMYKVPLLKGLKKLWPRKRTFSVLEDNDPTGFKSGAGMEAKSEANIEVFAIPPRSPDLNPLDYAWESFYGVFFMGSFTGRMSWKALGFEIPRWSMIFHGRISCLPTQRADIHP